jgi:hypothetical protein
MLGSVVALARRSRDNSRSASLANKCVRSSLSNANMFLTGDGHCKKSSIKLAELLLPHILPGKMVVGSCVVSRNVLHKALFRTEVNIVPNCPPET